MKLLRLALRNFKGVKDFTLNAQGGDVTIYGDNATGKSTQSDAFHWLLFGKDSEGRADFEIKTLTPAGEAIHGLDHTVETEFTLLGESVSLAKTYKEKWTKKRGYTKTIHWSHHRPLY
ncbi:MAG: ATP-binding protein [Candidatus Syntrophopropionicum ammoniitolerans]